jgi:hypothetical protein
MIMADTCLRRGSAEIRKKNTMSDTAEGGHRREQTVKVMYRRGLVQKRTDTKED